MCILSPFKFKGTGIRSRSPLGEGGRQPQGGCLASVCYPARSCPGRGTGKGYRKVGEGQSPQFPEEAVPSPRHQHLVGTRGVLWAGAGGLTVGRGPRWPTYWPGTAVPTWWPARCARTWGSPVARQWAGVCGCQLAGPGPLDHSGARSLDPRRGGGVLACQTFDRGPRWLTAGPGLPVKCGGPVLWTHARTKRFAESAVAFVRPGPLGKSWGSRFGQETACRVFG